MGVGTGVWAQRGGSRVGNGAVGTRLGCWAAAGGGGSGVIAGTPQNNVINPRRMKVIEECTEGGEYKGYIVMLS